MINPLNFNSALLYQLAEYRDHLVDTTPENEKYDIASDLAAIEDVIAETQGCTEIIKESYFVEYITDIINDCYDDIKPKNKTNWPYYCVKVDYELAARDAKIDYMIVTFKGVNYLAR